MYESNGIFTGCRKSPRTFLTACIFRIFCNKMFHETDPIPQAMPEETAEDKTAPQTAEEAEAPKDGEVTEEQQNKQ